MTITEIADRLRQAGFTYPRGDLELALKRAWHGSEPVHKLPDGRYALDLSSMELNLILFLTGCRPARQQPLLLADNPQRVEGDRRLSKKSSRIALLHTLPRDGPPEAVSLLDIDNHTIISWVDDSVADAPVALESFDALVGLEIRNTLYHLGKDINRWELVDLKPPQRSIRLDKSDRTLHITPEILISSTTGIRQPFGNTSQIARQLAKHEWLSVTRSLESDIKALAAFYRYGSLHGYVRLRKGAIDELLAVGWNLPGALDLEDIMSRATKIGSPIDYVAGSAPSWEDPWGRSRRGFVVRATDNEIALRWSSDTWFVDRYDIQAARVVGDPTSAKCNVHQDTGYA